MLAACVCMPSIGMMAMRESVLTGLRLRFASALFENCRQQGMHSALVKGSTPEKAMLRALKKSVHREAAAVVGGMHKAWCTMTLMKQTCLQTLRNRRLASILTCCCIAALMVALRYEQGKLDVELLHPSLHQHRTTTSWRITYTNMRAQERRSCIPMHLHDAFQANLKQLGA